MRISDWSSDVCSSDLTLGAKWITDIEGRITLVDGLQIAVASDNVFDVYPDHVPVGGAFGPAGYYLPYSTFSPFGFNGRFLFALFSFHSLARSLSAPPSPSFPLSFLRLFLSFLSSRPFSFLPLPFLLFSSLS